jgi:hypothetical protein
MIPRSCRKCSVGDVRQFRNLVGTILAEDRLREEYFDLLPDIRRVVDELEAEVKHCLVPISLRLDKYERLVVTSRVKECESALDSLRRRQEGATFDTGRPELYSLDTTRRNLHSDALPTPLGFDRARQRVFRVRRSCTPQLRSNGGETGPMASTFNDNERGKLTCLYAVAAC